MASAWLGQFDHKDLRPFPHSLPFARRRAYGMTMRVLTTAGVRRDKRHCALLSLSPSAGPLPFPGRTPPRTHRLASRGGRPRIVYKYCRGSCTGCGRCAPCVTARPDRTGSSAAL